jgi:hypothetical protein
LVTAVHSSGPATQPIPASCTGNRQPTSLVKRVKEILPAELVEPDVIRIC